MDSSNVLYCSLDADGIHQKEKAKIIPPMVKNKRAWLFRNWSRMVIIPFLLSVLRIMPVHSSCFETSPKSRKRT
jgi:hypothetical protein